MKTVVLQSFRTHDVPLWLNRCLQSVRAWADQNQWRYEFFDDQFFTLAPLWARQRCARNLYAVTDICRLQWMRNQLDAGYDRVIWMDADVLIFEPDHLDLTGVCDHAFAHELFLRVKPDGRTLLDESLNNSVMVFDKGSPVLTDYLEACYDKLRSLPANNVPRTALGPALLKDLCADGELNLLHGVGLFTLAIMREIANGGAKFTGELVENSPAPLGAANLCHFLRNQRSPEQRFEFDALYNAAVRKLLSQCLKTR